MTNLQYKTVKRILKENIKGEVSKEGCKEVKVFCEDIIKLIAEACINELEEYNDLREFYNLPKVKRIPSSIYKKILEIAFIQVFDLFNGDVGYCKKQTTTLSEADEWWYYA